MDVRQNIPRSFMKKFARHQKAGAMLADSPMLRSLLSRVTATCHSLEADCARVKARAAFEDVRARKDHAEHGAGQNKFGDIETALSYAAEIHRDGFGPGSNGESYALYQNQIDFLTRFLSEREIKYLYNFGICYAHVDAALAQQFPEKTFVGTDLSEFNVAFNHVEFKDVPNLGVRSEDFLSSPPVNRAACFWHSRTMLLLPAPFVRRCYKHAHKSGFEYVVGFEQCGLSEETGEPFTFSTNGSGVDTVYWRNRMYIHNYPRFLVDAGYKVVDLELFKTGHASPDFQVLRVVGQRIP